MPTDDTFEPEPAPKKIGRPRGSGKLHRPILPVLTEEELKNIGAITEEMLFLTRDDTQCVHHCMEQSPAEAARSLGWSLKKVQATIARPAVKLYAMQFRDEFMKKMVQERIASLKKVGVTSAAIQERLMALAQMDPQNTRGSIEGQVKALRVLAEVAGLLKDDPLRGKTEEELQSIVDKAHSQKATAPGTATPQ